MALDLNAVATGLAAAVTTAALTFNGHSVTASDINRDSVAVPEFAVVEFQLEPHQSYGGMDTCIVTCRFYVGSATEDGQRLARKALSMTGADSVTAALEADRTVEGGTSLAGACDDFVVRPARGPRLYTFGDVEYYGIEIPVFVMG